MAEEKENKDLENKPDDEKKKKDGVTVKKWQIILIIIIIILLLLGGMFVGVNWHIWFGEDGVPTEATTSSMNPADPDIDPNAVSWNGELPDDGQSGQSDGIKIPGYPTVKVDAGTTDIKMFLLNPEGNPCYFAFEIILDDTGETIYKSKMVPPGQAINDLKITKPLEKGTYKATIKITTTSLADQSPMNGANMKTEIIAE